MSVLDKILNKNQNAVLNNSPELNLSDELDKVAHELTSSLDFESEPREQDLIAMSFVLCDHIMRELPNDR